MLLLILQEFFKSIIPCHFSKMIWKELNNYRSTWRGFIRYPFFKDFFKKWLSLKNVKKFSMTFWVMTGFHRNHLDFLSYQQKLCNKFFEADFSRSSFQDCWRNSSPLRCSFETSSGTSSETIPEILWEMPIRISWKNSLKISSKISLRAFTWNYYQNSSRILPWFFFSRTEGIQYLREFL